MSGSVLKPTKCGISCDFSKITTYCFDCPRLMCSQCNNDLHRNITHSVMPFENTNLKWDDKDAILNIFDDRSLGNKVFNEVSRTIIPERASSSKQEDIRVENVHGGWICKECTFSNKKAAIRCEMCCFFRVVEDFTGEYNNKLQQYMDNIKPLFIKLDEYKEVPFENSVNEYMKTAVDNYEFSTWLKQRYLVDKDIALVNEVVEKQGYRISMNELEEKYDEMAKAKNEKLISMLPKAMITKKMRDSEAFLQPEEINKNIAIPNDMKDKVINTQELWRIMETGRKYSECQVRMLMTELNLPSDDKVSFLPVVMNNAELGPYLRQSCPNGNVKIEHVRQSLLDHLLLDDVKNFLKKECCLCVDDYPMPMMQSMLVCSHELCKECFKSWLMASITDRYPCKWICPVCPEELFEHVDKNLFYSNLKEFLRDNDCSKDVIKIFDEKLLSERLMGSEFFHWCANDQCVNGFEAEGANVKIQCPTCQMYMCVKCNREWKKEHENATCQEYEMWLLKNDPDLAKILNDIGIECPKCAMRYALAPGGCLHFECRTCAWVFCGACYQEFTSKCQVRGCTMGTAFHGHHPRNCLYFLRDNSVNELETMLKNADYPKLNGKPEKKCPSIIAEEKTLANKVCGEVVCGTSGLCERHYKEYLTQFINRLKVDPADTANSASLNLMLFQGLQKRLEKNKNETEEAFVIRLRNEVKKTCSFYIPKGLEVAAAAP